MRARGRLVMTLGLVLVTGCAAGSTTTAPSPSPSVDLSGSFDTTVTANGKALHVTCSGKGPVTVVLITGFGDTTIAFSGLTAELEKETRVCSYDRPGTGLSAAPTADQTFRTEAADLSALLTEVAAAPPYVVVAHSLGGGVGVQLAADHPDQVKGLLLLDATPVGWLEATREVPTSVPGGKQLAEGYALFTQPSTNEERFDGLTAFKELAGVTTLGSLPLLVDNAVKARDGLGLTGTHAKAVAAAWDAGQQRFARLSSEGVYRVVPGGHYVHQDQPALVLGQVRELVDRAS